MKNLSSVSYPLSPFSSSHLSHVSCQLSAVHCQLSAISCQLSAVSCPLSAVTCPARIPSAQQNVGSGRSWRLPDIRWQNKTSLRGRLQAQTLYHATPPIGKIYPFYKTAINFVTIYVILLSSWIKNVLNLYNIVFFTTEIGISNHLGVVLL